MSSAAADVSATAAKPIRSTLMKLILLTSGTVLLFTTLAFFAYEFLTFRQATIQQVRILGQVIAANSTAALAFDSPDDARAVLAAFRADPHIVAAALYDRSGNLFAWYPEGLEASALPQSAPASVASTSGGAVGTPGMDYVFEAAHLVGFEPVTEGARTLGTLFVKSNLKAIDERIKLYGAIALLVIAASGLLAWFMSGRLQAQISGPYNRMIGELQSSDTRLRSQLSRMDLLQHITRAIGDRQDLPSIFQVVLQNLERSLSVDFACACLQGASPDSLVVTTVGARSRQCSAELDLAEGSVVPVDANGLGRCLRGKLVYEPDVREVLFPFPRRLAGGGLCSLVIAPLIVENRVFGVLVAARREAQAFSSPDCEFLKQLTEHVALASHQTQLHGALQQAYDDLRQTQHTVMQQERLRALGQMASGIAHDSTMRSRRYRCTRTRCSSVSRT